MNGAPMPGPKARAVLDRPELLQRGGAAGIHRSSCDKGGLRNAPAEVIDLLKVAGYADRATNEGGGTNPPLSRRNYKDQSG